MRNSLIKAMRLFVSVLFTTIALSLSAQTQKKISLQMENATVENALIDKYACITRAKKVGGTKDVPLYLHQGAIL